MDDSDLDEFYSGIQEYVDIAVFLNCSIGLVGLEFGVLSDPNEFTKTQLDEYKEQSELASQASLNCNRLIRNLTSMDGASQGVIIWEAGISIGDLQILNSKLLEWERSFSLFSSGELRKGGHEPSSTIILKGIERLFMNLGRPITFGVSPLSSEPTTEFCRAIQFAFGTYALSTDWRNVTEKFCRDRKQS